MIIAFGHRKRVGKDTSAAILGELLGHPHYVRRGFAAELKWTCHRLFSWAGLEEPPYYDTAPAYRDAVLPALGQSPREVWITIGNMMRGIHSDVWIRCLLDSQAPGTVLAIPDVRYPNEIDAIRERGGLLVKIDNPRVPVTHDVADDAIADDFRGWDFTITNDGTTDELRDKLRPLAATVMERLACAST